MPCHKGTREQIEEGKRWAAERREMERINAGATERIVSLPSITLGEFLREEDPIGVLWPILVRRVFRSDSHTEHLHELSHPATVIYLAQVLDGEVINGGMSQFFSNSSGQYAHEALEALVEIGASVIAGFLERAIRTFPSGCVARDRAERNRYLADHEQANREFWDLLDEEYYRAVGLRGEPPAEDLAELLVKYMHLHESVGLSA